jgi:hypothetical protein
MRNALLVMLALLLTGCTGSVRSPSGRAATRDNNVVAPTPSPSRSFVLIKTRSVCGAWREFAYKMDKLTPKDQIGLVPYAQAVLKAAIADRSIPRGEYNAAGNLVAWVGSSRFTYYGNILSPQYKAMQHYCS